MVKAVTLAALFFLYIGPVLAETAQAGKDLAFLNVGLGGRPVGMGNAYSAIANDSNAVYWNPAGMLFGRTFELGTMQAKLASDMDIYYLSSMIQSKKEKEKPDSAWGVYWINGNLTGIPKVTANATTTVNTDVKPADYFAYQAHAVGIAYAGWLATNVSYGLNLTGFYQEFSKIERGKGYGASLTPGLVWMPSARWVVGTVVRDIVNYQKWQTGTVEDVIPEWRLGISTILSDNLMIAVEGRQKLNRKYAAAFHAGAEYSLHFIRFRAGFDEDRLTAGCGIYAGPIDVQYAYSGNVTDGIGDSHRVSVGFGI